MTSNADCLDFFANRLILRLTLDLGGFGSSGAFLPARGMIDARLSPRLTLALKARRAAVCWYLQPIRDRDPLATPADFVTTLIAELRRVGIEPSPTTLERWQDLMKNPAMQEPFPLCALTVPSVEKPPPKVVLEEPLRKRPQNARRIDSSARDLSTQRDYRSD
jgi:hypothetical protein